MSFISPIPTDAAGRPKQTGSLQQLGKDDFLQLLVTKLQHQDPLKPMEDENFISQLAQFSSLEQMNNISTGIETSNKWDFLQMQSLNNVMASGLIGKEIKADYSGVVVDGESRPNISFTLPTAASEIQFTIRNGEGNVVSTFTRKDLAAGSGTVQWDATDDRGNRVPEGFYTIEATATSVGGGTITPSLSLVGIVTTITYRDGAAYLRVNGSEIPLGDIRTVGEPGSNVPGE
ncbi:MAG: flagellar hook capping FlgD N-terminal domain-containing protein [candidate division Zixibacteria bacterium]|nr:flagellar hook capping FlgD N-terminal domain-containing protein [candidate division Zixibacteria bacterium]